ncbi:MAG: hypothetical protein ACM33T_13355 [Solirubrobacterales bacterium]
MLYTQCYPPLDDESHWAIAAIPGGEAFHLSLVSIVCNNLHRHAGPARALDCASCRHRRDCTREISDSLTFAARLVLNR